MEVVRSKASLSIRQAGYFGSAQNIQKSGFYVAFALYFGSPKEICDLDTGNNSGWEIVEVVKRKVSPRIRSAGGLGTSLVHSFKFSPEWLMGHVPLSHVPLSGH